MTDALTELYQFMLHRQKELSRRPELCLQLALTEWMTVLPSKIVASEDLPHQDALFYWQNKPQRAPRLTAHVGYCVPITSCAVSYPSNDFAYPGGLAALGFQDGRISVISSLSCILCKKISFQFNFMSYSQFLPNKDGPFPSITIILLRIRWL